jgi:6-phosphofructokinase 1
MAEELQGNCLVIQSGAPAAVANAALAGVVTQALNHACIEEIYGCVGGVEGLLREEFVDLAAESQQSIRALRHTPGAALGTTQRKLHLSPEFERAVRVCQAHEIRFLFMIGGSEEMEAAATIASTAAKAGWEMRVMGIPVSSGNTIGITDHAPGYASAVKYLATAVREVAMDAMSEGQHDLVTVIEVLGRQSGWLVAGSSVAKRRDHPEDPPHLIFLPEVPFDPNRYLDDVARVLKHQPACIVVVSQGLFDENGNYISFGSEAESYNGAPRGGSGDYLRDLASQHLPGVRSTVCKLGVGLRAGTHWMSQTDNHEAFMAGQDAVENSCGGASDKMITLVRGETDYYTCETGMCDLREAAGTSKSLPANWINDDRTSMSFQFHKYALPLIQGEAEVPTENGLPLFSRLGMFRVQRQLGAYQG